MEFCGRSFDQHKIHWRFARHIRIDRISRNEQIRILEVALAVTLQKLQKEQGKICVEITVSPVDDGKDATLTIKVYMEKCWDLMKGKDND